MGEASKEIYMIRKDKYMKNLIIMGARGFGREVYNLALRCRGYGVEYKIKGFLDDKSDALNGYDNYPPIIGTVADYIVEEDDVFTCSIGNFAVKKKYIKILMDKGGKFIPLIHPTAIIHTGCKMGMGPIVFSDVLIGADATLGEFVTVLSSSIVGHDCKVGDYSRIDCNVVCVGSAIVEAEVDVHTSAVINKVVVGKGAVVGAGSFVVRRVKENTTVYGNPAIKLK